MQAVYGGDGVVICLTRRGIEQDALRVAANKSGGGAGDVGIETESDLVELRRAEVVLLVCSQGHAGVVALKPAVRAGADGRLIEGVVEDRLWGHSIKHVFRQNADRRVREEG